MDAFEEIIGHLLREDNFWVQHSVKINLNRQDRHAINKPSSPRPEIDIAAFSPSTDTIYLLEVKSFLDSPGVVLEDVIIQQEHQTGRYKLLTAENYRNVLKERFLADWRATGHLKPSTKISFGLVAGNVYRNREQEMQEYFRRKNWLFWGPTDIRNKLYRLAEKGYENNAVTIVAKILTRV
ncbi:MAG: hypothetical protein IPN61_09115 [Bacteroidetes bacterium]|nr:hypothetical protein [Bacteroidota bacterium]